MTEQGYTFVEANKFLKCDTNLPDFFLISASGINSQTGKPLLTNSEVSNRLGVWEVSSSSIDKMYALDTRFQKMKMVIQGGGTGTGSTSITLSFDALTDPESMEKLKKEVEKINLIEHESPMPFFHLLDKYGDDARYKHSCNLKMKVSKQILNGPFKILNEDYAVDSRRKVIIAYKVSISRTLVLSDWLQIPIHKETSYELPASTGSAVFNQWNNRFLRKRIQPKTKHTRKHKLVLDWTCSDLTDGFIVS